MLKKITPLVIAAMLTACADQVNTHGQIIKDEQIESLKIGSATKRDVLRTLGSPSTMGTFDDDRWYYISERETVKPLDRKELNSRNILIVDFKGDKMTSIHFKDEKDGRYIEPSERTTRTQGEKLGVIEQMIDNLGKGL